VSIIEKFVQGKNKFSRIFLGKNILHSVIKARPIVRTSLRAERRSGPKLRLLATVELEMLCVSGRF
jgi:hypothetical protein